MIQPHSKQRKVQAIIPKWMLVTVSNSMLFIGAFLIITALIYLLINLDKSDTQILILLPVIAGGITLVVISQMILPRFQGFRRRNKPTPKF